MEYLFSVVEYLPDDFYLVIHTEPEVLPQTQPEVVPETRPKEPGVIPRPAEDDPFNVPAPLVDPTPKGISFSIKRKKFWSLF